MFLGPDLLVYIFTIWNEVKQAVFWKEVSKYFLSPPFLDLILLSK